ncbi:lipoprotein YvcA [Niallia taxi]|uniref:lipoprotein YvcA n=1 Tax=Niallia taxi TaxID=2499688 RepID=UPI002E1D34C2|nr:lipoprotein YvcA [Niallia taxi]MED4122269.1 lipoprotein YvcA [Niallia taxi]
MNKEEANQTQAGKEQKAPKEMDANDLPKVTAFQDEATREYMVSTKEVEPGYYLLESKSKKIRMLFPEEGKYSDLLSNFSKNEEIIGFDEYDKEANILMNGQITYYQGQSFLRKTDTMIEIISGKNKYSEEYQKENKDNTEISIGYKKSNFDNLDRKNNYSYRYFGFVKPNQSLDEGVEYSFIFTCKDDNQSCSLDEKIARDKVKKMISSIQFSCNKEE